MQQVVVGALKNTSHEDLTRLSTLTVVSKHLCGTHETDRLIKLILKTLVSAFQADRGFLILNPGTQDVQEWFLDLTWGEAWQSFSFTTTLLDNCIASSSPVLMIDTAASATTESMQVAGIRSVMLAPLIFQERLLGVVYLDSLLKAGCFEDNDLSLLSVIAEMVSVAIDRNLQADTVERQSRALTAAEEELELAAEETIQRLSLAAEFRDGDTSQHLIRVSEYCEALATKLGLDEQLIQNIKVASLLHDVGKLGIPDSILLKPGRFTDYERRVMQQHTIFGAKILANSRNRVVALAAEIARRHHEKWDGSGYPDGLAGEEIPLSARIVAVADVFDAVTSARRYKASYSLEDSFQLLQREAGSHFDPSLVEAFLAIREQIEQIHNDNTDGETEESPADECKEVPALSSVETLLSALSQCCIELAKNSGISDSTRAKAHTAIQGLTEQLPKEAKTALLEFTDLMERPDLSFHQATALSKAVKSIESFHTPVHGSQSGIRILVMDSDPYQREVLSTEAARRGMNVEECESPSKAQDALIRSEFDLLILELADVGAPEFLAGVWEKRPEQPVLILSRDGDLSRRLSVAKNPGCFYLQKPVPPDAVLDEVEECLPTTTSHSGSKTVLALDDDQVVLKVVNRVLKRKGYRVITVDDPADFWDLLSEHMPDLILLDLEMPSVTGYEICKVLRKDPKYRQLPIVVLTSHQEVEEYQKALESGADDVLSKPLQPGRLISRIESRLSRNRALRLSAGRDSLTGLVHHKRAVHTAEQLFATSQRRGAPFSICRVEIEAFDELADQSGWQQAAGHLREIAEMLTRSSRTEDVVTRWNGNSLLLLLPDVDKEAAKKQIESLNHRLAQTDGSMAAIKCNAEILASPVDGNDFHQLLERL